MLPTRASLQIERYTQTERHQNIAINSLPNTAPYTSFSTFFPAYFCLPPPVPTILKYFLQGGEHDDYDCSFSLSFNLLIVERHKTFIFTRWHSTAHKTTPGRAGHTGIREVLLLVSPIRNWMCCRLRLPSWDGLLDRASVRRGPHTVLGWGLKSPHSLWCWIRGESRLRFDLWPHTCLSNGGNLSKRMAGVFLEALPEQLAIRGLHVEVTANHVHIFNQPKR